MNSPKPDVKKFNLRLPVDLMEEAQAQADAMGISLNAYCLLALRNFISYTNRGTPRFTQPQRQAVAQAAGEGLQRASAAPRRLSAAATTPKVGRNDLCPCGSGKKAKHCHPENC